MIALSTIATVIGLGIALVAGAVLFACAAVCYLCGRDVDDDDEHDNGRIL